MAHKALCKIMLYKALKIPLIRPCKSLYSVMKQLSEAFTGAGFLIIALVCSDYDFPTVTMVVICIHFFVFLC